jgi:hypothetical protein
MRRCYNCSFIRNEHSEIFGINLGADFTAEHEWGIEDIVRCFHIDHELDGFDGRKNNKFPNEKELSIELDGHGEMYILEEGDKYGIIFNFPRKYLDDLLKSDLKLNDSDYYRGEQEKDLACAWDERSFGFITNNIIEHKSFVNKLLDSFKNLNGVIMLGGRTGIIDNAGLILLNYNKIPENIKEDFKKRDIEIKKEQKLFRKLEAESGVFEALKKSKKRIFLS